jgi:hypothetical protein
MPAVMLDNVHVEFPIYGTQRSLRKAFLARAAGGMIGMTAAVVTGSSSRH